MKRMFFILVALTTLVSTIGCACYSPGFRNPCISPFGLCANGLGGTIDYVDGGIDRTGACGDSCGAVVYENTCDPCAPPVYQNHVACGGVGCVSGNPCANCLVQLADGVRLVGEAALSAAATPFLVVGNILCSAGRGYETFPGNCCSNEIYLGDNCYQSHDFVDPCSPCGSSNNNCPNCSGTIQDGIHFETPAAPQSQPSAKNQPTIIQSNRSGQKVVTTGTKQQVIKQPVFINQNKNIKQAAYIQK
ncbi:MAG: hypothetical protein LBJ00_13410 [Planctomycetaceae bacterium]|jgi:hypothetical protein|nr:hypothetical protein [Planctomycetaceae bacterium]